jgi:hypothetical protein
LQDTTKVLPLAPCRQASRFAITEIFGDALEVASLEYTKHYPEATQDLLWPYLFIYLTSSSRLAECVLPFHPLCCNGQYFYPSKCFWSQAVYTSGNHSSKLWALFGI